VNFEITISPFPKVCGMKHGTVSIFNDYTEKTANHDFSKRETNKRNLTWPNSS
jgi:hypothetical protein